MSDSTEAVREELRVIGGPPGDVCASCGKVAYRARLKAEQSARHFRSRGTRPQRAYWSESCEAWHLSRVER